MQRTQEKKKDVPKADGERDHQLRCASFIISAQCSESKLTKTSILFKITHTHRFTQVWTWGGKIHSYPHGWICAIRDTASASILETENLAGACLRRRRSQGLIWSSGALCNSHSNPMECNHQVLSPAWINIHLKITDDLHHNSTFSFRKNKVSVPFKARLKTSTRVCGTRLFSYSWDWSSRDVLTISFWGHA